MTISPLGDSAVVIQLGGLADLTMAARVRAVVAEIAHHPPAGIVDVVPAFASIAIFFDPVHAATFDALQAELATCVARADVTVVSQSARTIEVPVCYGAEFGPDIETVAAHSGLPIADVIAEHSSGDYLVHAIGFVPGFPYLGGLASQLATPRRSTPRARVPAGAVGIGGAQTGIYPLVTPGGWNLIGRTPLRLFEVNRPQPALLQVGDRVRFRPISAEDFAVFDAAARAEVPLGAANADAAARPGIAVVRAGLFTTVQDLGRRGQRTHGVPLSGAADAMALRIVNSLVGNPEDAAGLEFTLVGPDLKFLHDMVVAFGGAEFGGLPRWRPLKIAAGTTLKFGVARRGCRGYLAVAGGIDVTPVLGSRSTYARATLGGLAGRALQKGDTLPVATAPRKIKDHWRIDERILPAYSDGTAVRVVAGAQAGGFDPEWTARSYQVSSHSDRMGARLVGEPVAGHPSGDLVSSPVAPGTIQVPPDGQPIVLLADAQTIGGYPQLAHVVSVDLPLVAQFRPGDTVRFRSITLAEARELTLAQERALALLREGLAQKLA